MIAETVLDRSCRLVYAVYLAGPTFSEPAQSRVDRSAYAYINIYTMYVHTYVSPMCSSAFFIVDVEYTNDNIQTSDKENDV